MNKIYRITLIFLLLLLFIINIVFFSYDNQFMAYFKIETELESSESIINKTKIAGEKTVVESNFFDLNILNNEKFKNLKDFNVDLSDFSLPSELKPEDIVEGGDDVEVIEKEPEFELGNPNPFSPSF